MSSVPSTSSTGVRRSSRPHVRRVLDSRTNDFSDNLYDLVHETLDGDLEDDIDDSDQDPDYVEESDHDSKSEQSADECNIEEVSSTKRISNTTTSCINTPVIVDSVANEVTPTTDPEGNHLMPIANDETPTSNTVRIGSFYYGRRTKDMIKKKVPPFRWRKKCIKSSSSKGSQYHYTVTRTEVSSIKSWSKS
ncbi:hypothetical protein J6590_026233 [Homalodisca vitripennis]|nr:hypothetical protein J6590_026233 [Homalodisca vitripennis]